MKLKLSPRKKASIMAFLSVSWEIICLVAPVFFVCALLLVPPVLFYLYMTKIPKVLGIIMGLFLSGLLFYFGKHTLRAIFNKNFKALLVCMAEMIEIANYSIISCIFIVSIIALITVPLKEFNNGEPTRITLQSIILFYYGVIVPGAILFGIFMSFGFAEFEKILKKQDDLFYGIGTKEELESWEKEKFRLKYFNPILLPFSCIVFVTRFLLKFFGIAGSGIKRTYQQRYQANIKKIEDI